MNELGLNRLFLHAFSIRFEHAIIVVLLRFNAPVDPVMMAMFALDTVKQLYNISVYCLDLLSDSTRFY